jgi:hypothetical protein
MAQKETDHPEDPTDWLMNRQSAHTDDLRGNCSTGYLFSFNDGAAGQSEFHHIVPIEIMQDSSIPDDKVDFARKCMALTDWDINNGDNLISLPTKFPLEHAERKMNVGVTALTSLLDVPHSDFGAIPDLPCHKYDHDRYNRKIKTKFTSDIWNKMAKKRKACIADGEALKEQLETASKDWRRFLVNRGSGPPSASTCWPNRERKAFRDIWYKPFSMGPNPRKAKPPKSMFKITNMTQDAWREAIFSAIR